MTPFVESLLLRIEELPAAVIFLFFFLSGLLQIVFPPYPGDTVLVFGGCLGGLNPGSIGFLALMGYLSATIITSLLLYELGYRMTDRIFSIPVVSRIMPVERRASVEANFKRYGIGLLAACKFIPGVNTLVILLGGVLRYPRAKGMVAITLSSVAHNLLFYYAGHMLGRNLSAIENFLHRYAVIAASVVALIAAIIAVWYFIKKKKRR